MNKHDDIDELIIQDLKDIYRKKDSIRKTITETREMVEGFERSRRKRLWIWTVSSVAAIACITAFIIYLLPSFQNATSDELFGTHYQRYSVNLDTRAIGSKNEMGQAFNYYETGQAQKALEILESNFDDDKSSPEYIFYKALFLLDAGEYMTAYAGFQSLIEFGGTYQSNARWYLALLDLKNNNYPSCRENLEKLRKAPGSTYRKKAVQLYRKIWFLR